MAEFQIFSPNPLLGGGGYPPEWGTFVPNQPILMKFGMSCPYSCGNGLLLSEIQISPHSPLRGRRGVLSLADPKCMKANDSKTIEKFGILFHICGNRMTRSTILILGLNPLGHPPSLQDSALLSPWGALRNNWPILMKFETNCASLCGN